MLNTPSQWLCIGGVVRSIDNTPIKTEPLNDTLIREGDS